MVHAGEISALVETFAPLRLAATWDNPGWQVGDPSRQVRGILLTLDVTPEVVAEALEIGANLIITHHPMIFRPLQRLRLDEPAGKLIGDLVRQDLQVYAAHTNLDLAPGGVNDVLAACFDLTDVEPIVPVETLSNNEGTRVLGWGAVGNLPRELTTTELAELAGERLGTRIVRVAPGPVDRHRRLAVCGGSGSDFIRDAAGVATAYLTSDVRYHQAQEANSFGLSLIDVGHYFSERPALSALATWLLERIDVPVTVSRISTSPFTEKG